MDGAHEVSVRWSEGSHYELTAQIVHDKPNAPVLIYSWTVQEILQKVDEESPRIGAEAPSRRQVAGLRPDREDRRMG